jgi:phosphoribosylformylglycinamidine synthase
MDVKDAGDAVYVLGDTYDELGGSEYYDELGFIGNKVPEVDHERAKKLYFALHEAMEKGLVASCHDVSDGGLGVSLAEAAFAGCLGMDCDLDKAPGDWGGRADALLFSESQSRFVVTVKPVDQNEFEEILQGCRFEQIGTVTEDAKLVLRINGSEVVRQGIEDLRNAWQETMRW